MNKFLDIFFISLKLGLTSFGGPIAHLGYFEHTYVRKKHWMKYEEFANIVALCQLLPGPTSSQVNFLVGLKRGGVLGAIISCIGFTFPSALLMYMFAILVPQKHNYLINATCHGLKLVAVAIVAQAILSMATRLCKNFTTIAIALISIIIMLLVNSAFSQFIVIILGALIGFYFCHTNDNLTINTQDYFISYRISWIIFGIFLIIFLILTSLVIYTPNKFILMIDLFYRSGTFVFGGGHVILPLLQKALVGHGMVTDDLFLLGYGAAQALPGPLFTIASYLGAVSTPNGSSPAIWCVFATIFIFLPSILIASAGISLWQWLSKHSAMKNALVGVNASVVGILAAAFYNPIWQTSILKPTDIIIVVISLVLLERMKVQPLFITIFCLISSILLYEHANVIEILLKIKI